MTNFTKKALMESFVELLNQKPFEKITVQDIVDNCGVNRNTFYYHFQDIYMLLEELVKAEEQRVIDVLGYDCTWEECCREGIRFAVSNKKAIYHLYYSINREVLEKYLGEVIDFVLRKYISLNFKQDEKDDDILAFIIKFYKYGFVGILLEWIASDFSDELAEKFLRDMGKCLENNTIYNFLNQ